MDGLKHFREIWIADFEFRAPPGERPLPVCLVAHELKSGRELRLWEDDLALLEKPPYPVDDDALFVAYFASAEIGCHFALKWPVPANVLDLYAEFRNITNGKPPQCGNGLLGALAYHGLPAMDALEKKSLRDLVLRGGPWTAEERQAILEYCAQDVEALARLLDRMAPAIDWPRALLRGRYMGAVASMEHCGIPIDVSALDILRDKWDKIQQAVIKKVDARYGVFDIPNRRFKTGAWEEWLRRNGIPWPRLPSGRLKLGDDTFREMARVYPAVSDIRELRDMLSKMRLSDLTVGSDGRNRTLLSPFRSSTGRNQPSNSKFGFGPAVWLRSLILAKPGYGLAYVDYSQQEFGIAAALSGDRPMATAYLSGDPYLAFAKQAGAVPAGATKETHGPVRELFKACVLAVLYGMGEESLASRIGQPVAKARELLRLHRQTYKTFWAWSDAAVDYAMLTGRLHTVFGWLIHIGAESNPRSLRNFPMQANGAEILRLACCLATERGISVCAPVHDAVLIEAPLDELDAAVATTQAAMGEASINVLGRFALRTDVKIFRHPDRYADERGERMWRTVWEVIAELDPTCADMHTPPVHQSSTTCAPVHTRLVLSSVSFDGIQK